MRVKLRDCPRGESRRRARGLEAGVVVEEEIEREDGWPRVLAANDFGDIDDVSRLRFFH